jgi:hypothetical protein
MNNGELDEDFLGFLVELYSTQDLDESKISNPESHGHGR